MVNIDLDNCFENYQTTNFNDQAKLFSRTRHSNFELPSAKTIAEQLACINDTLKHVEMVVEKVEQFKRKSMENTRNIRGRDNSNRNREHSKSLGGTDPNRSSTSNNRASLPININQDLDVVPSGASDKQSVLEKSQTIIKPYERPKSSSTVNYKMKSCSKPARQSQMKSINLRNSLKAPNFSTTMKKDRSSSSFLSSR